MRNLDKAATFYSEVDRMVAGGAGYMDAIIQWCFENELEIESVTPLITKNSAMVSNLQIEAENLNFLPKTVRLPF